MSLQQSTIDAKEQFNKLFGNMMTFSDDDMIQYDSCYEDVFKSGINYSFMSCVFFAQYSAEILMGMLASNPFRKYLITCLDDEANYDASELKYWHESMNEKRFGIEGYNYDKDKVDIMAMANDTFIKISALNDWFGTDEGSKEFDMYCLSKKAVRDIKRIICEYPYLMRKYDHDQYFANEIMDYASIVMREIAAAAHNE